MKLSLVPKFKPVETKCTWDANRSLNLWESTIFRNLRPSHAQRCEVAKSEVLSSFFMCVLQDQGLWTRLQVAFVVMFASITYRPLAKLKTKSTIFLRDRQAVLLRPLQWLSWRWTRLTCGSFVSLMSQECLRSRVPITSWEMWAPNFIQDNLSWVVVRSEWRSVLACSRTDVPFGGPTMPPRGPMRILQRKALQLICT